MPSGPAVGRRVELSPGVGQAVSSGAGPPVSAGTGYGSISQERGHTNRRVLGVQRNIPKRLKKAANVYRLESIPIELNTTYSQESSGSSGSEGVPASSAQAPCPRE